MQDADIYSLALDEGKEISFNVKPGRQAYLVQTEGESDINGMEINERDALEIVEEDISIKSKKASYILIIEMKK